MSSLLKGQAAVVTGANSGVGRSAAELLARAGANVTMVCRSRSRGEQALVQVRETGKAAGAQVALELADMSRQEDVRDLAARLAARLPAIDILVNNAGIAARRCVMSAEGFELTFATNHLGHFLLTHRLLDQLAAGRGRIVNVSSEAHRSGKLRRAPLEAIARGQAWKGSLQAYSDSKLANVLFTFESVRRWGARGITADALHPGVLATEIWNKRAALVRLFIRPFTWFMAGPEVGGEAVMHLVGDPSRDAGTGRYFKVRTETEPDPRAHDVALAHELWERSLEWTEG